jgi:hypothetical protein
MLGNYGSRSERLDLESNCILVLAPKLVKSDEVYFEEEDASWLQHEFSNEWNSFLSHSLPMSESSIEEKADENSFYNWLITHVLFRVVRTFL